MPPIAAACLPITLPTPSCLSRLRSAGGYNTIQRQHPAPHPSQSPPETPHSHRPPTAPPPACLHAGSVPASVFCLSFCLLFFGGAGREGGWVLVLCRIRRSRSCVARAANIWERGGAGRGTNRERWYWSSTMAVDGNKDGEVWYF